MKFKNYFLKIKINKLIINTKNMIKLIKIVNIIFFNEYKKKKNLKNINSFILKNYP